MKVMYETIEGIDVPLGSIMAITPIYPKEDNYFFNLVMSAGTVVSVNDENTDVLKKERKNIKKHIKKLHKTILVAKKTV